MNPFAAHLAILCGLPQSGKSTFAQHLRLQNPWVVICPDEVRLALHGEGFYKHAEPFVWASTELMVRALLRGEHMVLIDATNTTQKRRKMWLDMASEFDLELRSFVLDTPVKECQRRNQASSPSLPGNVIDRMAEQWEPVEEDGIEVVNVVNGEPQYDALLQ